MRRAPNLYRTLPPSHPHKFELRTGRKHTTWETTLTKYFELLLELGETEESAEKRYADIAEKVTREIPQTGN
jgi:hypothetical protein